MAIVTEFTNYANTEIPYVKRDDFLTYLNSSADIRNETFSINGTSIHLKWGTMSSWEIGQHLSTYTRPNDDVEYIEYAIKSKENVPYKYIVFNSKWSNSSIDQYIKFASNVDIYSLKSLVLMSGINEGSPRIVMLEVGEYVGLLKTWDATNYQGKPMGVYGQYIFISKNSINEALGESDGRTYDDEFGGISDADGYDPNFDNSSDIIPMPNAPSIGVSNVGFINVYKPTEYALRGLGADLFPDFAELPPVQEEDDVLKMLAQGFEYLGKNITTMVQSYINSNLINYIIDCHCLPVTPTLGEVENIKIGFKSFDQTAMRVSSDYVDFDCGALNIKEYYGNFIDYVGTRASLYLPFVGFVPIKNEYFQNGTLSVKYRFNIIDGSFMCYVMSSSSKSNLKDTVIGTYSGNACVHIPITGVNYANMVSGVVTGASSVVAGIGTGNVGLAVGGSLNTLSCKPQMQSSNDYNSTSSFLGIRYPYLLIEREVSNFSELYPNEYGVPLNATKTISELTGYVEMDENIHIEINCMNEEKTMIKDLLTGGIII